MSPKSLPIDAAVQRLQVNADDRPPVPTRPSVMRYPATTSDVTQFLVRNVCSGDGHVLLTFDGQLNIELLRRAMRLLMDIEPILGCRFVEHWYRPFWERRNDLDEIEVCRVVSGPDGEAAKWRFLTGGSDPRSSPIVQAVVLRNDVDTLCVKLNHTASDAPGFMSYMQQLAHIYTELEAGRAPSSAPRASSRSFDQFLPLFDFRHRWRILKFTLRGMSSRKGFFRIPEVDPSATEGQYIFHRIPADRIERASKYGRKHRATLTYVLLAATFCALRELLETSSDRRIGVGTTVDMRMYLPLGQRATPVANLSGPTRLLASLDADFEEVVLSIRDQFKSLMDQRLMGGSNPAMVATFPGFRQAVALIPFSYLRSKARRVARSVAHDPRRTAGLANLGEPAQEDLRFGNLSGTSFCATGSIYHAVALAVIATRFKGAVTLCMGFTEQVIKRSLAAQILARIEERLPQ